MRIRLLYFSVLRDLADGDEVDYETGTGIDTVGDLLAELYAVRPALADWDDRLLLAVNGSYATRDTPIASGDEVALMPPVQGG